MVCMNHRCIFVICDFRSCLFAVLLRLEHMLKPCGLVTPYGDIDLGADSIKRCHLTCIGNPIVEIRRSYDRLFSTMGFPILVRCHLYIESVPWVNNALSNAMLHDVINTLREQMLSYHHYGPVTFIWGQFCQIYIRQKSHSLGWPNNFVNRYSLKYSGVNELTQSTRCYLPLHHTQQNTHVDSAIVISLILVNIWHIHTHISQG